MFSAEQTTEMTLTAGLRRAMACMAPIMAAAPAMSYFIFSMPSAGLMEMPPVSKVMPLPTRPRTGAPGAGGGLRVRSVMTMRAGGSAEPLATAQKASILSCWIFSEAVDFAL